MLVSEEIRRIVTPPWTGDVDGMRFARLRADLDAFVSGAHVGIASTPRGKPLTAFLARLAPPSDAVWDIRSRDPRPGIRVLGAFAGRDVFVALVWSFRERLGGVESRQWRDLVERAKADWRTLFPTWPRHQGERDDDFVSSNFTLF